MLLKFLPFQIDNFSGINKLFYYVILNILLVATRITVWIFQFFFKELSLSNHPKNFSMKAKQTVYSHLNL